jgi:hypothetical protein
MIRKLLLLVPVFIIACAPKTAGINPNPVQEPVQFGQSYEQLSLAQKDLIDNWYETIGIMLGKTLDPVVEYNEAPLSTRTTFEAVSHSLEQTVLTDEAGNRLGCGIDLIENLETIRGHIPNVRGDLQFRIYVTLKPDAIKLLKDSVQFKRGHDNTVYHHGYPYSYRLDGTPSTQFSITQDFQKADIDVDYRSTTFPLVLFNGHLTAANSDVRAGKNFLVHSKRWAGLPDWWRDPLDLLFENVFYESSSEGTYFIPPVPRIAGDAPIHNAVYDFLTSWLVEKNPRLSAAYLAPTALKCAVPDAQGDDEVDLARYKVVSQMYGINEILGDLSSLEGKVVKLEPGNPAFSTIEQPYDEFFTLAHVPAEMAAVLTCGRSDHPIDAHLLPVGDYYGVFFELKGDNDKDADFFQLWARDSNSWKLVSYFRELESRGEVHDLVSDRWETPMPFLEKIAHPVFAEAVEKLFSVWFLEGNLDSALDFFDDSCNSCPALYLAEGQQPPASDHQARQTIREKLRLVRESVPGDSLEQSVRRVDPWNSDLKLISQSNETAYTLVSVPDGFAETLLCVNRDRAHEMERSENHGTYYASIFQLNVRSDHPAVIILIWAEEAEDDWKVVSYHIETP